MYGCLNIFVLHLSEVETSHSAAPPKLLYWPLLFPFLFPCIKAKFEWLLLRNYSIRIF